MNELLEMIGLNGFQAVMIGFAVVLVAPIAWRKVKGVMPSSPPQPVLPPVSEHDHTDLVDVVECWEHLIACCEANDMKEAADEIYKVFPLFANKGVKRS